MLKKVLLMLLVFVLGGAVAFFVFYSEPKLNTKLETAPAFFKNHPFRLGLDLSGGSHLVYRADVSGVPGGEVSESMDALRDIIERRVNLFGVSEPVVQVQGGGFTSGGEEKLIVDLPGVTDVEEAVRMIGETPLLEFKVETPAETSEGMKVDNNGAAIVDIGDRFVATELTGRHLKRASVQFDQYTREAAVSLKFDEAGTELFARITKENVGKPVAIYLDGSPISIPVVREEITGGEAVISGDFSPQEAKQLVGRLNSGALPVPISLISRQTIGATLGGEATSAGVRAATVGFLLIAGFLILWYRLPGISALLALAIYVSLMLALFKLLPVTLTAAGIAGFIISIGLAVDANILIFERLKEEMRAGRYIAEAVSAGFERAWTSIRDSNLSTVVSAAILFWLGTPLIKGFALTLGMGVLVSMFSAVMISRVFLLGLAPARDGKVARFLFSSGIGN